MHYSHLNLASLICSCRIWSISWANIISRSGRSFWSLRTVVVWKYNVSVLLGKYHKINNNQEYSAWNSKVDQSRNVEVVETPLQNAGARPMQKANIHNPHSTKHFGRPNIQWLDSVDKDMKIMGIINLTRNSHEWDHRWAAVEEAKVHDGQQQQ